MRFRGVARRLALVVLAAASGGCGDGGGKAMDALEASALAHREKGAYDSALAHYDRAIALEPKNASAINSRGITFQLMGQYARAVENYDAALELQPEMAIAMKNRGRAHFYLGNFTESARDLSAGLARDTANAFVVVWLHMVKQHLGGGDTTELARNVARTDPTRWPAPVAALYLGRITFEQFADTLVTGDSTARALKRCGGAFYGGEYLLWKGRTGEAKERLAEAASICPRDESEYMGATAELGRLDGASAR